MKEKQVCEITVTGTKDQEWQGSVYFPASGERQHFRSLLDLIRTVERGTTGPATQSWKESKK